MERYIRKVLKNGSVTIPVKIRKELGLVAGTVLSFSIEDNSVVLRIVK